MFCMDRAGYAYALVNVQFPFLLGLEVGVLLAAGLVYLFFRVAKRPR
jgi:hypothetical protein